MNAKRIGNLEITSFHDSESVWITYWCNSSVSESITLRSNEDINDLRYAIECVINERARLAAQRS